MGKCWYINCSKGSMMLWNFLKVFVSTETKIKIKFTGELTLPDLVDDFHPD